MENELSLVVDTLPGLFWTALPDGRLDFVNRCWTEYTGRKLEDAAGDGWQSAVHPDDRPALLEFWQSHVRSGVAGEAEARLRRVDGEHRWFSIRIAPVLDGSGRVVKWCGVNSDIDDRKRAEDALRAHENEFRLVFDGLPALVTLMSPSGNLEVANRHVFEYFGATLDELKSWENGASFHPDDHPSVLAAWARSVDGGMPCDFEARQRRADGAYRWFRIYGFPLRNAGGRIQRWYFLQLDVDDMRRAEALLAGEKQLLEMIASGDGLPVVFDAICELVEAIVGDSRCSIFLVDPMDATLRLGSARSLPPSFTDAIVGKPAHLESGPCEVAASRKTIVIVPDVESETRWDAVGWRGLAREHGLRSCWASPILSRAHEALGTFAIYGLEPGTPTQLHRDLIEQLSHIASIAIERTRSEDALKRNEAFLAEAQRLSSTGGFCWHLSDDTLTWSDEVYRIFEVPLGAPATLELTRTRLHPDDVPAFLEMRLRQMADVRDFEHDYRLIMPDESIKYLHVVAHATRDPQGRPIYNAAVQDVTQRKLSEDALGKARAELARVSRVTSLGALTASIAHEVNQPLSGIVTNASTCLRMLASEPPNLDGARETARRTIRDGHRASDVIMRLRALFTNKQATTEPVDLNEATREVIALSASELQRSRVSLRMELAEVPPVVGDRVQLQQVILNLLLNASDAMSDVHDRPRQILIRTERDESDRVRLTVRDAGVGFDPQGAERLFDAFYTTKRGGMGIGLSVSRSIIESHQGRLWATPNDGPGATFAFSIPRGPEGAMGAEHVARSPG